MLISTNQIQNVLKVYGQQNKVKQTAKTEQAKPTMGKDQMTLSEESKVIQTVKAHLNSVPDIRQDKVDELQKAVKTGTYHVSGKEIAEKMLGRVIVDRLG